MKGKVSKLLICMTMAAFLAACGNNQADAPVTDSQIQAESTSKSDLQESSIASSDESQVVVSSEPSSPEGESEETSESSEAESTEATQESVEATSEEPTKEQESMEPSKAPEKSSEAVVPSQETAKPSVEKEQSVPSQESKPSPSTPSVEQISPSQEQTQPSVPEVHTCSFDGGSVTTAPTCNAEGVKTYSCSCGATRTESIPKTSHNYVTESQAATCSAEGYERTKCSICGDIQSETILGKTGHDYYESWWQEPDCEFPGSWHRAKCHNCDFDAELPLGALGHIPDAGTVIHPGTCTDGALLSHKCTRCGCDLDSTWGEKDPNNHNIAYDNEEQIWYCAYGCGLWYE